ncbi:MAG: sugar ABC transporter permease [Treponema sp.]|jgi:multiple sugar transport system permease protein|nr:sugar ABC transporter permease [Treponema sp.]
MMKIFVLKKKMSLKIQAWCWLFIAPTLIFYVVFRGWPIICSVIYSTWDWSGMTTSVKNVGLDNYKDLLKDELFWNAFFNSIKFMLMFVPVVTVLSLFFAYILNNEKLRFRGIYRTMYFVPVVTTSSVIGIVMIFIWSAQGPVNSLFNLLGIIKSPINWLGNSTYAMITVVLISLWKELGIYMVYWLAGLQSVPKDVYEAAMMDGAGKGKVFFSIVLPLILPIGGIILTLCVINALKVFDLVKTLTEGGPYYATDVIATYVYRMAFSSEIGMPRLGYASAASLLFGIFVILVGIIINIAKRYFDRQRVI